jgi:hypothetical protein
MQKLISLLLLLMCCPVHTKQVPFIENPYLQQAPPEIMALAEQAAQIADFTKDYEVAVPKKAGLQVNPWNRFITGGIINPQTNLPYIEVNPEWFLALPQDQQIFLLARCFTIAHMGVLPMSIKIIPYAHIVFSWIIIFLVFWLLGNTVLRMRPWWMRLGIAVVCIALINVAIGNRLVTAATKCLAERHDTAIVEQTLEKTHNRQAAIAALQSIDQGINNELAGGDNFWEPYKDIFKTLAQSIES